MPVFSCVFSFQSGQLDTLPGNNIFGLQLFWKKPAGNADIGLGLCVPPTQPIWTPVF
jgi:hypothetical protein